MSQENYTNSITCRYGLKNRQEVYDELVLIKFGNKHDTTDRFLPMQTCHRKKWQSCRLLHVLSRWKHSEVDNVCAMGKSAMLPNSPFLVIRCHGFVAGITKKSQH